MLCASMRIMCVWGERARAHMHEGLLWRAFFAHHALLLSPLHLPSLSGALDWHISSSGSINKMLSHMHGTPLPSPPTPSPGTLRRT